MKRIIRHAGTWLPLSIIAICVLAVWRAQGGHLETLETVAYLFAFVAISLGLVALIQMARYSADRYPSFFVLLMIYKHATQVALFLEATWLILHELFPILPLLFFGNLQVALAVVLAMIFNMGLTSLCLFFGRKRGWLEETPDPVPLRSVIRAWCRRLRRNRRRNR